MKCRLEIYLKIYDSCNTLSLVCTKNKLLRCLQLQNIFKYHCRVISFLIILKKLLLFLIQGKLIALKYEGQQLKY